MSSTPPEAEGSQTSQPAPPANSETRKGTGVYLPNAARLSPAASPATSGATKHSSSAQRTSKQQQHADKEPNRQNQQQRQRQHKRPTSSCEIQRQHSSNTPLPGRPASALAVVHDPHQEWKQQQQHGQGEASSSAAQPQQSSVLQAGLEQQVCARTAAAGVASPFAAANLTSHAAVAAAHASSDRPLFPMELQQLGSFDATASAHAFLSDDFVAALGGAAGVPAMKQQHQGNAGTGSASSSPAANILQLQQQLQLLQQQQQHLVAASQRASMQAAAAAAVTSGPGQTSTGVGEMSDLLHKALPLLSRNTAAAAAAGGATTQQSNEVLAASLLALRQQGVDTRHLFGNNSSSNNNINAASSEFGPYAMPVVQQLQQRLHMQQQQWGQLQSVPEHPASFAEDVQVFSSGELPQLQGLLLPSWPNATGAVAAAAVDTAGDNVRPIGRQSMTLLQLQQLRHQQEQQQHVCAGEAAIPDPLASDREHLLQKLQHMRTQQVQQQQQHTQQASTAGSSLFSSSQELLLPQDQLNQLQQQQPGDSVDIAASSLFSSSQERMIVPQQQQQQSGFVDISASALFSSSQEQMLLQQEQLRQQQQQQTSAEIVPVLGPMAGMGDTALLQLQQLQQLQQQQQPGGPANVQQALNVIDGEINRLMQLRLIPGNAGAAVPAAAAAAAASLSYEQAWQQQMVAARAAVRAAVNATNFAPPPAAASALAVQPRAGSSSNRSSMDSTFPYTIRRNSMDSERLALPSSSRSSMEVASSPYAMQRSNRNSLDLQQGRGSFDMQYTGSIDMQYNSRGSLDMLSPYGTVGPQLAVPHQQQLQQLLLQQQQSLQGGVNMGVNQGVSMEDIQARLHELREAGDMKQCVEHQLMHFLPL